MNWVTWRHFLVSSSSALVSDQKQSVASSGLSGTAWSLVIQLSNFSQVPLEFDQGNAVEANKGMRDYTCVINTDITVMKAAVKSCTPLSQSVLFEDKGREISDIVKDGLSWLYILFL